MIEQVTESFSVFVNIHSCTHKHKPWVVVVGGSVCGVVGLGSYASGLWNVFVRVSIRTFGQMNLRKWDGLSSLLETWLCFVQENSLHFFFFFCGMKFNYASQNWFNPNSLVYKNSGFVLFWLDLYEIYIFQRVKHKFLSVNMHVVAKDIHHYVYTHTNKCVLRISKWFLLWQRSPLWALCTTSESVGSPGYPIVNILSQSSGQLMSSLTQMTTSTTIQPVI